MLSLLHFDVLPLAELEVGHHFYWHRWRASTPWPGLYDFLVCDWTTSDSFGSGNSKYAEGAPGPAKPYGVCL